MIVISFEAGEWRPKVDCDHCGELIEDARHGNYEWEIDADGQPTTGEVFFTHKACCRAFENEHGGRASWHCGELGLLPVMLGNNLGLDWELGLGGSLQRSAELTQMLSPAR